MQLAPESDREAPASPRSRRGLWLLLALLAIVAIGLIVGTLASWHFSDEVLVPDHSGWPQDVEVEAVHPHSVTLARSEETMRPGVLGLDWQSGHAIAGPILSSDQQTVTRHLRRVEGYLVAGLEVGLDWNVYAGTPRQTLGLPFSTVHIQGELGPMPAWLIPAGSDPAGRASAQTAPAAPSTWAIVVHGINSSPQNGLRIAPLLHAFGLPSLLITYRDDLGAPSSPDGYHHMGLTEWRDLQSAARYALSHGAQRLVLIGYSMGGAIVAQFMEKSPLRDRVAALVLDAPALDWKRILSFNATEMGFPAIAALPVEWAIGARIDADWDSLDALRRPQSFHLPILLFHGTEDDLVPIGISDDFAAELPRWVTYYRVPYAGHTQSWNVNPRLYDRRLRGFLGESLAHNASHPPQPSHGPNAANKKSPAAGTGLEK